MGMPLDLVGAPIERSELSYFSTIWPADPGMPVDVFTVRSREDLVVGLQNDFLVLLEAKMADQSIVDCTSLLRRNGIVISTDDARYLPSHKIGHSNNLPDRIAYDAWLPSNAGMVTLHGPEVGRGAVMTFCIPEVFS